MKATLEYIEQDSQSVSTFWFRPMKPIKNVPGQFTEIYLPHKHPDDRGQKRWFTIFSAPTEDLFAITTKFADNGSSFKRTLRALKPGVELDFAEPMGDFILPKNKDIPLLCIAGGIGVTPFRSMAQWLVDTSGRRDITLLYATHTEEDQLFLPTLTSADIKIIPIVSHPSKTWTGQTGLLSSRQVINLVTDPKTHIYLSGPEIMVEHLTKEIIAYGSIPKHQVITDYFPGYERTVI